MRFRLDIDRAAAERGTLWLVRTTIFASLLLILSQGLGIQLWVVRPVNQPHVTSRAAARLWRDDLDYAERRYRLRAKG